MSIEKFGNTEYKKAESDREYAAHWIDKEIDEVQRRYAIPLHKYVGRNGYICPREGCQTVYDDEEVYAIHMKKCCPGLLDEFPTYSGCLVNDGNNGNLLYEPPAIQQYISQHPPMK